MYNKKAIMEKYKDYIVSQYGNTDVTCTQIAQVVGVDVSTLTRYAREEWGLKKSVKQKMTSDKVGWLKENYNLPYKELREYTGCCDEVIRQTLIRLGIKRTTKYRPFKVDMNDEEFIADLKDPRLTSVDIEEKYAEKYAIGQSRIQQLRKKLGIRVQLDFKSHISSAEKAVMLVLDELDLAYICEKKIGRFHIDFYLGKHICIEVQGKYWHSLPARKIRDSRKKKFLEDSGYKVIYVKEEDLGTAKEDIQTNLVKLGFPI